MTDAPQSETRFDNGASTLDELLAAGRSTALALVEPGGTSLTFGALRAAVDESAAALCGFGVRPGDRVATALPGAIPAICALFAIARAQAITAPLNPHYTNEESAFYLRDVDARLLLVAGAGNVPASDAAAAQSIDVREIGVNAGGRLAIAEAVAHGLPASAEPDDVALLLHTSGTTSRPKRVPLRHDNLCTSARNIARWYRLMYSNGKYG